MLDQEKIQYHVIQLLNTSCSHFTPDEDPGAAGPRPYPPSCWSFYGPTPVCKSTLHQNGRRHHLPPGQITVSLRKAWKHCEDHVLSFLQCFQHHPAWLLGDKLELTTSASHPGSWTTSPTGHSMWGLRTVCRTQLSAVQGPHREQSCSVHFHLVHCRFLPPITLPPSTKVLCDSVIVGLIRVGDNRAYREVNKDFVDWCQQNDLRCQCQDDRRASRGFPQARTTLNSGEHPGNRHWEGDILPYKYLGVHLNNKLDWTDHTAATYKKGQSRLHLLRKPRSFGVQGAFLTSFYDSVVTSDIFYGVVCCSSSMSAADRRRLGKFIKKASRWWERAGWWTSCHQWYPKCVRGGNAGPS